MLPVGKTIRWIENWMTLFLMGTISSITMQSLGKIVQRAPAVGAKMWCLFFCCCHAPSPEPERRAFEGCIVWTSIALPFIVGFRRGFQRFFRKRLIFQKHYIVLILVGRWRHKFRETAVKNCENSKNRQKGLCAPLRIDSWGFLKKFHCSSLGPGM